MPWRPWRGQNGDGCRSEESHGNGSILHMDFSGTCNLYHLYLYMQCDMM